MDRVQRTDGERAMEANSLDYFRLREQAERAAAENATSDAARRAHQKLAREYAQRLISGSANDR